MEHSENCEEILTPEEIKEALENARRKKITDLKIAEYNRKLREPVIAPNISAEKYFDWVFSKAKATIDNFQLTKQEEKIYKLLCLYFSKDLRFEEEGYSLKKGIMLYGGVGCGKTTIMKLMRENPLQMFGVVECVAIADLYKDKEQGGGIVTNRYSSVPSICFNDLGIEIESGASSHMGNKKNVMAEIILNHYEKNEGKIFRMHFTTNLNAEALDKEYTIRVRSRLREMCNIISLEGIEDKRK